MIVPSIDLQNGEVVQLVGGRELALTAGTALAAAERFGITGELAVIDLDAAMGKGSNRDAIVPLLSRWRCRVGGGIRSVEQARAWLDLGAHRVILGTAARPEILRELPRERVIAAVDAVDGDVVVEGWTTRTGRTLLDTIRELAPYVGGFLVTFVEREGRMGGTQEAQVAAIVEAADGAEVTIAGGVSSPAEVARLHAAGVDAQVGMGLYTGAFSVADCLVATLRSDRSDGLWPTVVTDPSGRALGLVYSNPESLRAAVAAKQGIYWSRRRGLWRKGETSGNTQELLEVALDCDADALRFVVRAHGPFCHTGACSCFGAATGLDALEQTLASRRASAPTGSYTARLFGDEALLRAKLVEEAGELADAEPERVAEELADLLYFAIVRAQAAGVAFSDVERVLDVRARKVTRRPGNAKTEVRS